MDFDPSEFLAMAMSEENAVYTAPDLPQSYQMQLPTTMTVEGGLLMEQNMQIPTPTFETLDLHDQSGLSSNLSVNVDPPIPILQEALETASQPSPADRTASPHPTKRPIATSYDESRFRKDFFNGDYERVKLFRLHCTICDQHLGCAPWLTERQMRIHKLFSVAVCRRCFDFYGDINFPLEDGSEIYCCWCGEGGEVFCCSTCPKVVCKKCITRNFGESKVTEIDQNDNWACFFCKPTEIWPHRAIFYGLQRLGKEMRSKVANLPKEEKQAYLSKDSSHCCPKMNEKFSSITLPPKDIMSQIPICLVAVIHQSEVKNQPAVNRNHAYSIRANPASPRSFNPNQQQVNHSPVPPQRMSGNTVTSIRQQLNNRISSPPTPYNTKPLFLPRGPVARPAPGPKSRQMIAVPRPQATQSSPYFRNQSQPVKQLPQQNKTPIKPHDYIDLVNDTPLNHVLTKSTVNVNDISWLENGIKTIREAILPVNNMIDQFASMSNTLKTDFTKLTSFSEQFSENVKITICKLAKVNQDLIDGSKACLNNRVTSVISDIQYNNVSNTSVRCKVTDLTKEPENETVTSTTPRKVAEELPVSSPDDDMGELTPALLCEAVLEVEGNKENESRNKRSTPSVKKTVPFKRGKKSNKKSFQNKLKKVHLTHT